MIETKRLILRPFNIGDVADVYEYLHVPMVHCFENMKTSSLEEAERAVLERTEDSEYYFAIVLKESGKVIGEIFSHPEGAERPGANCDTFSPCWMLNPEYHGKGYAFEAAHAYFDFLFNEKGARRLYAYTEDYNKASQNLCEKLGMRREGFYLEFISFVNDENGVPIYENTYEYAILHKEWKTLNK